MALTVVIDNSWRITSKLRRRDCTITFDSDYDGTEGGEVVTPSDFLLTVVESILPYEIPDGYLVSFDKASGLLEAFYGNYDAADGPLIQVPDGTDLSSVNVRAIVEGF